jgi:hypothetical protein
MVNLVCMVLQAQMQGSYAGAVYLIQHGSATAKQAQRLIMLGCYFTCYQFGNVAVTKN